MKRVNNLTTIITLIIIFSSAPLLAQVETQDRSVGSFTGVHQSTSADVYIKAGSSQTVTVKADSKAISDIITEVSNGVLMIKTRNNLRNVRVMEVYITMNSLEKLKNSGSGDIAIEGPVKGKDIYVGISGSGDLDAEFDAINMEIKISGSGDVNLSGVRGNFSIDISGSGDVMAGGLQLDQCTLSSFGSGDIKLKGKAAKLISKQSGSGDLNAYGLTAVEVVAKSNGSGDVVIHAVEKIQAILNGSGDLTYYGNPQYVDVVSNGSGEVYRK